MRSHLTKQHIYMMIFITILLLSSKNTTAWRSQDVITPILSNKEGDKLIIGLIKNLTDGEHIPDKYKITIEKLPKDDNQLF